MTLRENQSTEDQIRSFERQRQVEEEAALNNLLTELDANQRELSEAEIVFLRRQLDRIDGALSKPHEDGIERDDLTVKSKKINQILAGK